MPNPAVIEVMRAIKELSSEDRDQLVRELAKLANTKWFNSAASARLESLREELEVSAIQRAVHRVRHSRPRKKVSG
jgi:hypothetical protein